MFSILNYLLLSFYPILRDIFTLFLRETSPFAAYFPANYVVLDGVFLGLYVAFIFWLVAGVSRVSLGIDWLIRTLAAASIITKARGMIEGDSVRSAGHRNGCRDAARSECYAAGDAAVHRGSESGYHLYPSETRVQK